MGNNFLILRAQVDEQAIVVHDGEYLLRKGTVIKAQRIIAGPMHRSVHGVCYLRRVGSGNIIALAITSYKRRAG